MIEKKITKEDIKGLGWIRYSEDDRAEHVAYTWPGKDLDTLNLYFCQKDNEIVIVDLLSKNRFYNDSVSFHGKLITDDQKGELKTIMAQIGII